MTEEQRIRSEFDDYFGIGRPAGTPRDPLATLLAEDWDLQEVIALDAGFDQHTDPAPFFAALAARLRDAGVTLDAPRPSGDEALLRDVADADVLADTDTGIRDAAMGLISDAILDWSVPVTTGVNADLSEYATPSSGDEAMRAAVLGAANLIHMADWDAATLPEALKRAEAMLRAALVIPSSAPDVDGLAYEQRVQQMADALHVDCLLEWQAIAAVDDTRQITQHMADAHYSRAHDLVRRIWPGDSRS